jgi:predicted nucleotidyltransferase
MLEALSETLKRHVPDLVAAYLFGSRARDEAGPASDYDIAVLVGRPLDSQFRWALQEELAVLVHANVDLVDLRRASTVMRVQVLKDGRVLVDNDRSARELFEATALSDYARLNEERRQILADIRDRGTVHG